MWFFSEKLSSKQIPEKVGCLQLFIGMECSMKRKIYSI